MLTWGWTLIRLYRDIEHSEKLLPNKHIFILHGSLLTGYLLLFALTQLITYVVKHSENEVSYPIQILEGVFWILTSIEQLLSVSTFFLVIKLMIPITPSDKEKRSKFQRFLFKGFAEIDELRAAVLANNPDMDQD